MEHDVQAAVEAEAAHVAGVQVARAADDRVAVRMADVREGAASPSCRVLSVQ